MILAVKALKRSRYNMNQWKASLVVSHDLHLDLNQVMIIIWVAFPPPPYEDTSPTDLMYRTSPSLMFPSLQTEFDFLAEPSPNFFFPFYGFMDGISDEHQFEPSAEQMDTESPFNNMFAERNVSEELAEHLTALTLSLPRDHPERAPSINLALGMTTLTQANVKMFIRLYFHHWNRHSPILHRGSFDVMTSSLPLILVVALTGALFSVSTDHHSTVRSMLDIAEESAFRDPDFQDIASGIFPEDLPQRRRAVQALQAAFSIAQLQLREGSVPKRKFVRSTRFDQIIYVSWSSTPPFQEIC